MKVDTLGWLRDLFRRIHETQEKEKELRELVVKDLLRQSRRGWTPEEMHAIFSDSKFTITNKPGDTPLPDTPIAQEFTQERIEELIAQAQERYGDQYVSGYASEGRNQKRGTTKRWDPNAPKPEKPKKEKAAKKAAPEKKATASPKKTAAAKKTDKTAPPAEDAAVKAKPATSAKEKRARRKAQSAPPVAPSEGEHYEEPVFNPDAGALEEATV